MGPRVKEPQPAALALLLSSASPSWDLFTGASERMLKANSIASAHRASPGKKKPELHCKQSWKLYLEALPGLWGDCFLPRHDTTMREGNPTLHPPRPARAQVAFHESIPPSEGAGLPYEHLLLAPERTPAITQSPKLSLLATSMALPLPSQHCLLAKACARSRCSPTPLQPFSLPIVFVQRREEVPYPPSSQLLEQITGFPGRDAPTPKQIKGPATFSSVGALR